MTETSDLRVLAEFVGYLEDADIKYAIGGSIASSVYGEIRFTQDADISVEPFEQKAEDLYNQVKSKFYIAKNAMYDALSQRSSFNVIHIESAFKIDVFVRKDSDFSRGIFLRRRFMKLDDSINRAFAFVSPEDVVLLKLQWFKDGGGVSEKQWRDVIGVLSVQRENLEMDYLTKMSTNMGINELLQKAIGDA